ILATGLFQMVLGAANGLLSTIGQQRAMAGRMSMLLGVAATAPAVASYIGGGALSEYLEGKGAVGAARVLFLAAAGIMLAITLMALARPKSLFDAARVEHSTDH